MAMVAFRFGLQLVSRFRSDDDTLKSNVCDWKAAAADEAISSGDLDGVGI